MPKLLFLQVGQTFEHLATKRGDYDLWFRHALGLVEDDLEVVRPFAGQGLPLGYDYDGVVVSGSAAMVTDREPWSVATADYLLEGLARNVPILGVCYGHQLLADALGGKVANNPNGRQVGTVQMALSPAARTDPLFSAVPDPALVHVSHRQSVVAIPDGVTVLAESAADPCYAFRAGSAWGVQFHPEFDASIARVYVEARADVIRAEGGDLAALLGSIRESDHGRMLLKRFVALVG